MIRKGLENIIQVQLIICHLYSHSKMKIQRFLSQCIYVGNDKDTVLLGSYFIFLHKNSTS